MGLPLIVLGLSLAALTVVVFIVSRHVHRLHGRVEWLETKVRMVVRQPPGEPGKEGWGVMADELTVCPWCKCSATFEESEDGQVRTCQICHKATQMAWDYVPRVGQRRVVSGGRLRHYRSSPDPLSFPPYQGKIHSARDDSNIDWDDKIRSILSSLPEGASVSVVVEWGIPKEPPAEDDFWCLLRPHVYGHVRDHKETP